MALPPFDFPKSFWDDLHHLGPYRTRAEEFVRYLVDRISHKDYRGEHIGQQNRTHMDYERLRAILDSIHLVEATSPQRALWIPNGDDNPKSRSRAQTENGQAFQEYLDYVSIINKATAVGGHKGSGTYNSVKKNWFTDMERMGLVKLNPVPGCSFFKALTLGKRGNTILAAKSFEDGYLAFSSAIDDLIGSQILAVLIHILWNNRVEFDKITLAEYQFIVSDKRPNVDAERKIQLIRGYRALRRKHKIFIESHINKWSVSNKGIDYGNWKNQAQQSFKVFNASQYFRNFNGEYLTLATHEGDMLEAFRRASNVRIDYLRHHGVGPINDFEFHHVIPFSMITTKKELKDIDTWKNLIYIDSKAHKRVPTVGNSYLCLESSPAWRLVHFLDTSDMIVIQPSEIQVSKNPAIISRVLDYNARLLRELA